MTRPIKFRAWDSVDKRIRVWDELKNHLDTLFDYASVMQFTGLLDKNGKEIYEGDILEESDHEKSFSVEYSVAHGGYIMPEWYDEEYVYMIGCIPSDIEIIGNVWKNPELLK